MPTRYGKHIASITRKCCGILIAALYENRYAAHMVRIGLDKTEKLKYERVLLITRNYHESMNKRFISLSEVSGDITFRAVESGADSTPLTSLLIPVSGKLTLK